MNNFQKKEALQIVKTGDITGNRGGSSLSLLLLWYYAINKSSHPTASFNTFSAFNGATISDGGLYAGLDYLEVENIGPTERAWFKASAHFSRTLIYGLMGAEADGLSISCKKLPDDLKLLMAINRLNNVASACDILSNE
ncbi:MAG: hypothetical protein R3E13_10415 [Alphaproteobacteria bacterium]